MALVSFLDQFVGRLTRSGTILLSALLVGLTGIIDYFTGFELSFSIFYLIPIFIAAWYGPESLNIFIAALSAVVWYSVDINSGHHYSNPLFPLWNTGVRLGFFLVTGRFLVKLKSYLFIEKKLARTDALTGVLNSRAFTEELQHVLNLSRRHNHSFSLAYIDLDNFKTVNDTLGHNEGDRLLQIFAQTLNKTIRNSDYIARLGGDEFALLLPETDATEAQSLITRARKNLDSIVAKENWPVGASIGLVTFEQIPDSTDSAIRQADNLMYRVKKNGKNRVEALTIKNPGI